MSARITGAMPAEIEKIRAHVEAHKDRERAMFTIAGVRALLAELDRLREALKPFAKEAEAWAGYDETEPLTEGWGGGPVTHLVVAHLRAASRALSSRTQEERDG